MCTYYIVCTYIYTNISLVISGHFSHSSSDRFLGFHSMKTTRSHFFLILFLFFRYAAKCYQGNFYCILLAHCFQWYAFSCFEIYFKTWIKSILVACSPTTPCDGLSIVKSQPNYNSSPLSALNSALLKVLIPLNSVSFLCIFQEKNV